MSVATMRKAFATAWSKAQSILTESPHTQASHAWEYIRFFYADNKKKDRLAQMKLVVRPEVAENLNKLVQLFLDEADRNAQGADENTIFAFFKEHNIIKFFCDFAWEDVPIGTATYVLLALHRLINHCPVQFLQMRSTFQPLSDAIASMVNYPEFREHYADSLVLLLLSIAHRIREESVLLQLFIKDELQNRSGFPLFTGITEYLRKSPSDAVRRAAEKACLHIVASTDQSDANALNVAQFIVMQSDFLDILLEHLCGAYLDVSRRSFEFRDQRNTAIRERFFGTLLFIDKIMMDGHDFIVENLQSRIEVVIGNGFLDPEIYFTTVQPDEANAALVEAALMFLREIFTVIKSERLLDALVNGIFVHKPERAHAIYSRILSSYGTLSLAALQFFDVVLSKNHILAFRTLVGQHFAANSFLSVDEFTAHPFTVENVLQWNNRFPNVFGEYDDVQSYFEDARASIFANFLTHGVRTDIDTDAETASAEPSAASSLSGSSLFAPFSDDIKLVRTATTFSDEHLVTYLLRKFEKFLENTPEVNAFVTGLLSKLYSLPFASGVAYLLSLDLPLQDAVPSLAKSVAIVTSAVTSDARYGSLPTKLPKVFRRLGIASSFSVEYTAENDTEAPASPGSPLADPQYEVAVALFLEFRREIVGTIGAWKTVINDMRLIRDRMLQSESDIAASLVEQFDRVALEESSTPIVQPAPLETAEVASPSATTE